MHDDQQRQRIRLYIRNEIIALSIRDDERLALIETYIPADSTRRPEPLELIE